MSLPSSRYVRREWSDHAGSDVLSDEFGGDVSISLCGTGAGREGGGIDEADVGSVGDGEVPDREVEVFVLLG